MFDRDDDPNNPYLSLGISPYATYKSVERGGVDQYDFNIAFNFNDRFYFGVTIGAYDVNYRKSYFYGEDMGKGDDYSISSETVSMVRAGMLSLVLFFVLWKTRLCALD